ncbi:MAG: DUF1800 domain-containing protein [Vicinamibacteria bacterium]
MQKSPGLFRSALLALLSTQLALTSPSPVGAAVSSASATKVANDDATIGHVLNRLTFGASASDIARVKQAGLGNWIDAQLRPAAGEDMALNARLASLRTIAMPTSELREKYEVPANIRQQVQKARAEREEAMDKERQDAQAAGKPVDDPDSPKAKRAQREDFMKRFPELAHMDGGPQQVIADLQSGKVLRASFAERQLDEVMTDFWFNHFNVFARKGPIEFMVGDYERAIRSHAMGKFEDLLVATAQSPAMLWYLDNWQSTDPNFNPRAAALAKRQAQNGGRMSNGVNARGGQRRPGAFNRPNGQDPQMAGLGGDQMANAKAPAQPRRTYGINENYARELMELHTLGVDGGYTQADVIEVAKAFTGWTIVGEGPGGPRVNKDSHFSFEEPRHVHGDKQVLGAKIKNGGEKEGLEILHRLATQPATAKFIATKLVRRFVSDDPPQALVCRAAATFEKTKGDIREVVRTIVTSEEFLGTSYRAAKVKTPLEFVVSAVRVSDADVTDAKALTQRIAKMGMPLYLQQPPTGYKDAAEEWISTSALLERMNFALDLSAGRIKGVHVDTKTLAQKNATLETVAAQLLPSGLSPNSKKTLEGEAVKEGSSPTRLVGLVLGSPEFQKR